MDQLPILYPGSKYVSSDCPWVISIKLAVAGPLLLVPLIGLCLSSLSLSPPLFLSPPLSRPYPISRISQFSQGKEREGESLLESFSCPAGINAPTLPSSPRVGVPGTGDYPAYLPSSLESDKAAALLRKARTKALLAARFPPQDTMSLS